MIFKSKPLHNNIPISCIDCCELFSLICFKICTRNNVPFFSILSDANYISNSPTNSLFNETNTNSLSINSYSCR